MMLDLVPSTERLTEIFSQCAAAAFFLFATAALVGLMNTRLSEVNAQIRELKRDSGHSAALMRNLRDRAHLLRRGIIHGLVAAGLTVALLVDLFVLEFFSIRKAYGAAILFALAAGMLGMGLFRFAQEARLALREPDL